MMIARVVGAVVLFGVAGLSGCDSKEDALAPADESSAESAIEHDQDVESQSEAAGAPEQEPTPVAPDPAPTLQAQETSVEDDPFRVPDDWLTMDGATLPASSEAGSAGVAWGLVSEQEPASSGAGEEEAPSLDELTAEVTDLATLALQTRRALLHLTANNPFTTETSQLQDVSERMRDLASEMIRLRRALLTVRLTEPVADDTVAESPEASSVEGDALETADKGGG
jgi:hypothetical protein